MMTDTFIELADRYYDQKMTAAERAEIENRLQTDDSFAAQMSQYREARQAVAVWSEEEIKARFRRRYAEHAESSVKEAKTIPLFRRSWLYAAAAIVVLLVAVFLGRSGRQASPEDIFGQHFSMPSLSSARGAEADSVAVLQRFQQANAWYLAEQYDSVLLVMPEIVNDSAFNRQASAWLHIGMSHYALGQEVQALEALAKVSTESPLVHQANWYRGLIFLKQGKLADARPIFTQLVQESRFYGKKAQEIIDQLGD
ncbi:MAG: tetratricopeptide repeat protein [Bacteroidota bacterium]